MNTETTRIFTLGDARDEKSLADARMIARDEARARIERDRQTVIQNTLRAYPEIGVLCSGKFHAQIGGRYVEKRFLNALVDIIKEAKTNGVKVGA